jgi:hypothetical protein
MIGREMLELKPYHVNVQKNARYRFSVQHHHLSTRDSASSVGFASEARI